MELDEPVGRHDGTVAGVRYFAATDNHGVFATESKLSKVQPKQNKRVMPNSKSLDILDNDSPDGEGGSNEMTFSMNYHTLANDREDRAVAHSKPRRPLRRSLSAQHRAIKVITSPLSACCLQAYYTNAVSQLIKSNRVDAFSMEQSVMSSNISGAGLAICFGSVLSVIFYYCILAVSSISLEINLDFHQRYFGTMRDKLLCGISGQQREVRVSLRFVIGYVFLLRGVKVIHDSKDQFCSPGLGLRLGC